MKNEYIGKWRIVEMEMWDQSYIDLVTQGYILFEENDMGEFQFGTVVGALDYHIEPHAETERLEFSWSGSAELDPVSGRGWAMLNENGQLQGMLYFHEGDDSGFTAERSA